MQAPSEWVWTTAGKLSSEYGGSLQTGPFGSQLHASDYSDIGTPVVMPQDIVAGHISAERVARVGQAHVERLARHQLEPGDVVFSRRGDVRRFAVVSAEESGWLCGTGCLRLRLGRAPVEARFLRWYLSDVTVGDWLERNARGATMLNLNTTVLSRLPLRIPPVEEQRRIADILDRADAVRRKRRAAIALTDELLRSTFLDMFGDPVTNPKGWPQAKVGGLLDFLTSGSRGWAKYYSDSGPAFIRIQNVLRDEISLDDITYVDAPESAESRRTRVQAGDVLLSITADLGRTAVVPAGLDAHINQHLALLRFAAGIEPYYVSAFLASVGGQRQFDRLNRQAVKAGLNFGDIRSLNILLPPLPLQRRFAKVRNHIHDLKDQSIVAADEADAVFHALTQRAFRGEL